MATEVQQALASDLAIPAGEFLAEELECRGIALEAFAASTGMTSKQLAAMFRGEEPLTRDLASAFERSLGIPARLWLNLEAAYRTAVRAAPPA